MSHLPERVVHNIQARRLFKRSEAVLAAISGGMDSMVMLHLLAALAPKQGWRITVAHFNHQLRGRSSDADARLVERTARRLGLAFVAGRANVRARATAQGISVEMAARSLRHEFLAKTALRRKIRVVALAHHADDQVELFFLRLLRGAGTEGLAGMKWRNPSPAKSSIMLVRPLLAESKTALKEWAGENKIPFREDATNAQLEFRRNRVRHELLPLLTKKYQPALTRVILRQMEIFTGETEFVTEAARQWLKSSRREKFDRLPVALQRRCLQLELMEKGLPAGFDLIEEIREAENRVVNLNPTTCAYRDAEGRVHLQPAGKPGFQVGRVRLKLAGRAGEINFGQVRVLWEIKPQAGGTLRALKKGVNCERFDADKVGSVIELRHWRPGDRFQPIGMARAVKLQDLFVNMKVPRAERRQRVVATARNGGIFWVEGLRLAERFKLDKSTLRGLKWCWKRV